MVSILLLIVWHHPNDSEPSNPRNMPDSTLCCQSQKHSFHFLFQGNQAGPSLGGGMTEAAG